MNKSYKLGIATTSRIFAFSLSDCQHIHTHLSVTVIVSIFKSRLAGTHGLLEPGRVHSQLLSLYASIALSSSSVQVQVCPALWLKMMEKNTNARRVCEDVKPHAEKQTK